MTTAEKISWHASELARLTAEKRIASIPVEVRREVGRTASTGYWKRAALCPWCGERNQRKSARAAHGPICPKRPADADPSIYK